MIFNSQTLNTDPFPYVGEHGSRHAYAGTLNQTPLTFAPRPEYNDYTNVNPLLADMREFWPVIIEDWLAALDDPWFMDGVPAEFGIATEDHRDHAKKVLTRLAALGE